MLNFLQRIGKSLMFPIATLPAAALLVRLGKEDMLDIPFITAAGNGILGNLAIIFAIGIAMGLSHDGSGGAALAGAIGYLVLTEGAQSIDPDIDMKVFGGVIAGIAGGLLYNKYYNVKFPDWLAFFGGKRFVPIITSLVMVATAFVLGFVWPPVQDGLDALGNWILNAGTAGVGIYGVLNRLLIPVGLHHVMNAVIWFDFGTFTTASGEVFHGEINRFLNGDPEAGYFLAGFFPVMMFGLPAACAAMYVAAKKERKAAVGGLLFSIAFTSFLTGVTEPIEFSFMFLSPLLYVVHALLTGVSMIAAYLLDIRHGFGFSAGLIDYLLNFTLAQNPLLLAGLGIVMGAIYFVIFYFLIIKLDLKTPGREDEDMEEDEIQTEKGDYDAVAYHYIEALGGMNNIESLDYCTTRLRMQITDQDKVDEKKLKRLGARGVMKMSKKNLQVIVGTTVEFVADAMRKRMDRGDTESPDETVDGAAPCEDPTSEKALGGEDFALPIEGRVMELREVPDEVFAQGMMGQGFAIDPSGDTFTSPVEGKVVNVFPTKHAIGLETETGIEILIHIGLDTVKLQGEGFELLVEDGQAVTKGTPLIKVDFDKIRDKVPSIVTPIVFTNLNGESLTLHKTGNQDSQTTNIVTIQK
ncbi:N-acetylglucosamine-specific PTS transporter subunit IIBC [Pontibacillus salipaludis]|uniref:PTS N-acetyl glucosamine transporter subunit IIABC n=1 Tax=Pontibacillus salipaludis TaxID=1697394 RepID=A0ABQ1Q272_9BACI|nr:N-acetylglucosamine-specific PTS transporter subunit IIBC [Pontibacillus salipaludis]GGD11146.1 PTS N-acetyl glucosamine transporter subunit IIABC [Pontibacillus salipaludis]